MEVTILDNGPIRVELTDIKDVHGNVLHSSKSTYLCRCGHSANKPFCDGTHKSAGFVSVVSKPAPEITV